LLPFTAFFVDLAGLAGLVGLRCLFVPMAAQVSPVEVNQPLLAFRLARLPPTLALTSVKRIDQGDHPGSVRKIYR
jgi:hypothetical protein